ncbi:MAG: thiamine pyrophosphate-dependent dehydrogenase E1 component subunit alpha, partial [Vicinamibacterales bacterium]
MKGSTLQSGAERATGASRGKREHDGLTRDELLDAYRTMLLSRKIDDKEIQLKNQSQAFFQISGAGHEAILVAAGRHLRPGYDWFFPYYRDRALCLALGMTALEMLLASVGAKDDPANGGRQMPSHWGHRKLNIPSQSSATGTQCLHAVGAAEAGRLYQRITAIEGREERFHDDEVTYVSVGDGATSEGEFWESLNTACTEKLPVIYLVEDNGYAISVPVEVQTPGGDISRLVESFPSLRVFRCDGTDYLASHRTMREAVEHVRARKGPAFVHATVIRPYSHSLSDDEKLYKTAAEREAEARRDPLVRMRQFLRQEGLASDEDFADVLASVEREVNEAARQALAAEKPSPDTATHYVFSPDVDPTSEAF